MPPVKRLRVIAGPNGSGKSTFVYTIQKNPPIVSLKLGVFINADEIESKLKTKGFIDLNEYGLKVTIEKIHHYFKHSDFSPVKSNNSGLWRQFSMRGSCLCWKNEIKLNSVL